MKIDGSCLCGQITYEAEVDPERVGICHCTDCQTQSGTAFRTFVPAQAETFKLLSGEPKTYIRTGGSGAKRAQAFCPECGTPIYATAAGAVAAPYLIRVGTARQRDALVPKRQIWHRSALRWLSELDTIQKFEMQSPPR